MLLAGTPLGLTEAKTCFCVVGVEPMASSTHCEMGANEFVAMASRMPSAVGGRDPTKCKTRGLYPFVHTLPCRTKMRK